VAFDFFKSKDGKVKTILKRHFCLPKGKKLNNMENNNNISIHKKALPFGKALGWANVYFIGVGGIGMSALARYFIAANKNVAGYDKTKTDITDALIKLGADVHFKDVVAEIPESYLNSKETLVVYTPAIPKGHAEFNFFKQNGFQVLKRSELLGLITKNTICLAVAGTHGKTTTTSILGHLMKECDVEMTAFLGGISENYNSNLIQNGSKVTVVEADEFDRSFLTLSPDYACITSMDADHLDIYGDTAHLTESFLAFSKNIKPNGKLFVKKGLPLKGITYAIEDDADYMAKNITIENGTYVFDVQTPNQNIQNLKFNLPGRHNLSNALIALAMAVEFGCSPSRLASALASYKGVKRRFSYQIKTEDLIFIDDYAHHPEEINAVHQAVREMYPNQKVLAIFQPHLFSRTRDFADDFAASLEKFDSLLLLDIYPARELPIEGVTSQWLLDKIDNPNKKLITKSEIVTEIQKSGIKIIITIGAGDIGAEVKNITKKLSVAS
jgi:UDP-N-acetylmuramate--alanine ligase